jgi:ABC-2 type transport system permease protein
VINGKALGGIAALTGALFVVLFIALATLLVYGIVPDGSELVLIGIFAAVSFLLIFSYFTIALFMSTAMDESGSALIYTIIVFIVLSVLVPTLANDTVMESVVGSQPELPQELLDQMQRSVTNTTEGGSFSVSISNNGGSGAWDEYNERVQAYWEKRQLVKDTFALFSPTMNYQSVTSVITSTMTPGFVLSAGNGIATAFSVSSGETTSVDDTFSKILANMVALLLFPAVFFGLAYVRFMRLDVR